MSLTPRLVEANSGYDFSGIHGYEKIATPEYAVLIGDNSNEDFRYVEVYTDGTIRYGGNMMGDSDGYTYFNYNPKSNRGYFSDYAIDIKDRFLEHAKSILQAAGVPEQAYEPDASGVECDSISNGDRYAWLERDSAHRLTGIALKALAFSRWSNYEWADHDPIPEMTRDNYAQALGAIVSRFGPQVLASEANRLASEHFNSLHTELHTPGLIHKPHSDGTPRGEEYMNTADEVLRGTHNLFRTMRNAGRWVNFMSIFGDADFWAVTRDNYPEVFNATTTHIMGLPDPLSQSRSLYAKSDISPVGVVQHYFPGAHQEILTGRSDFTTDIPLEQAIKIYPQ